MRASDFIDALGCEYFAGVPDSLLRPFCDCLEGRYGRDPAHHVVAANEGNAVALASGYYLATGKPGCVYMQNSGQGNAINPIASLASPDVYATPMVLVVGWRGEPSVRDEPQHAQQGRITLELLDVLGIESRVLGPEASAEWVRDAVGSLRRQLDAGRSVAFVVRKGALEGPKARRSNAYAMTREEAVGVVAMVAGRDPIVCTTGKASRELFEIRESRGQGHGCDFLTVGSMGHASSIAMGVASQMPNARVWCVDGDGAVLMHMGALPVIGASGLGNFTEVVINNGAHETVGGMPTVAGGVDLQGIARACGFRVALSASAPRELESALEHARSEPGPAFVEARCALGSRPDLGRPTTTPTENKQAFMSHLARARRAGGAA